MAQEKEIDWLNLIGKTLMIVGALGPAGSARTREIAMNNALQVLRMRQEQQQAELERRARLKMHENEMAVARERVGVQREQVGVQRKLAELKEEELELERKRLEELRGAFEEYIKFMLEGKEDALVDELKRREQANPAEPLKQIYPDLNVGGQVR